MDKNVEEFVRAISGVGRRCLFIAMAGDRARRPLTAESFREICPFDIDAGVLLKCLKM